MSSKPPTRSGVLGNRALSIRMASSRIENYRQKAGNNDAGGWLVNLWGLSNACFEID